MSEKTANATGAMVVAVGLVIVVRITVKAVVIPSAGNQTGGEGGGSGVGVVGVGAPEAATAVIAVYTPPGDHAIEVAESDTAVAAGGVGTTVAALGVGVGAIVTQKAITAAGPGAAEAAPAGRRAVATEGSDLGAQAAVLGGSALMNLGMMSR